MSTIFLFDLDGTLCKSRKKVQKNIIKTLSKANESVEIGILTGSDLDFLKEQCEELFLSLPHKNKVYAMACNGTKSFIVGMPTYSNLIGYGVEERDEICFAFFPELEKYYITSNKNSFVTNKGEKLQKSSKFKIIDIQDSKDQKIYKITL